MLLALKPATLVLSPIWPLKDSITLLLVLDVVSAVLAAVHQGSHDEFYNVGDGVLYSLPMFLCTRCVPTFPGYIDFSVDRS